MFISTVAFCVTSLIFFADYQMTITESTENYLIHYYVYVGINNYNTLLFLPSLLK